MTIIKQEEEKKRKKIVLLDCGGTISSHFVDGQYKPSAGVIDAFVHTHLPHIVDYVDYHVIEIFDSSDSDYSKYQIIIRTVEEALAADYRGIVLTHGTDTLAFIGAVLTFAFPFTHIPIVLTASQIPLVEPMTDGKGNLFGSLVVAFGNNSLIHPGEEVTFEHEWLLPEVMVFMTHHLFLASRVMKYNATEVQAFAQRNEDRIGSFIHKFICNKERDLSITWTSITSAIRHHYCLVEESDDLTFPLSKYSSHKRLTTLESENVVHKTKKFDDSIRFSKSSFTASASRFDLLSRWQYKLYEKLLLASNPPKAVKGFTPVGVIRLFPGIDVPTLEAIANISAVHGNGLRCVVVSAFGTGNGPRIMQEWLRVNKKTTFAVICTQCPAGRVTPDYAASLACYTVDKKLIPLQNVALCDDLTLEAAVGKLAAYFNYFTQPRISEHILETGRIVIPEGEPTVFAVLKRQMEKNQRGELTGANILLAHN